MQAVQMSQAMASLGANVTLVSERISPRASIEEIFDFYGVQRKFKLLRVPFGESKWRSVLPLPVFIRLFCRLNRVDLIFAICQSWKHYRLHELKCPIVAEAHLLRRYGPKLVRKLFESPYFRGLVVVNETLKEDYVREYGLDPARILVEHNGAEPVGAVEPAHLEASHGVRCGYVGNIYRGRGIDTIVELAGACANVDFHVFGGTPEQVEEICAGLPAARPNLHMHGFVPPTDTDALRLGCDILLAPYGRQVSGAAADGSAWGETGNLVRWMSPMKVFEYMAAGRAIIASDLPAIREILTHGHNAWLCPPDDFGAWREAVQTLASDPARRARLAEQAHSDFIARHSWTARAERIAQKFDFAP